jgi:dinuclear metal center YbgI/SA1388 family protein
MARVSEIMHAVEAWAPPQVAWEKDNVGLQTGDPAQDVNGVLIALELTQEILNDAVQQNCNLIVTHHPFIFHPIRNITADTPDGSLLLNLIRSGINLYAAHTNLDFSRDGVSFALAHKLGLSDLRFLHREASGMRKIAVFVPPDYVENVTGAMAAAGAGLLGDYEYCSFRLRGTGTYKPLDGAQPFAGSVGTLEQAEEIRIEMVVPAWRLSPVVKAMISAHPYDEVAYDVFTSEALNPNFGAGVFGHYPTPLGVQEFLSRIKSVLNTPTIRYTIGNSDTVRTVAVCGGSGSDLLRSALLSGADAFVTADIKYHTFHEARGNILFVDAGHYETEIGILDSIEKYLSDKFPRTRISVTKVNTNPIQYT